MRIPLGAFLACAVFASAIGCVVAQHQSRKLFVEIQDLEMMRDDLNEEWGRLQLEQSTWGTNDRIEALARTRIGMREPAPESLILLEQ
ncbi:MAG: cell division protein FtsL [Gammaproteobacteria bacterium]|nr:cell division protein FtsL [Gammaproteobacteria bacterium]